MSTQILQNRYLEIKTSIRSVEAAIRRNLADSGPEDWTRDLKAERDRLLARLDEVHLLLIRYGGDLP